MLVPGQVIFFPVARGRGTVRMRRKFVKLCRSLVRIVWHCVSHPVAHPSWSRYIPQTVQLRTSLALTRDNVSVWTVICPYFS
jgi:hypothetical protein